MSLITPCCFLFSLGVIESILQRESNVLEYEIAVFSSFQESLNPTSNSSPYSLLGVSKASLDSVVRSSTDCSFPYKDNRLLLKPSSAIIGWNSIEAKENRSSANSYICFCHWVFIFHLFSTANLSARSKLDCRYLLLEPNRIFLEPNRR